MFRFLLQITMLLFAPVLAAQVTFVEVTPTDDPYFSTPEEEDFWVNAVAPADYDGDGNIDLAVLGFYVVYNVSAVDKLILFHNDGEATDGSWAFTATEVPLGGIVAGASDLAWGDFDQDGDYDLVVASEGVTALFRNDGGTLAPITATLPGYFEDSTYDDSYDLRSVTWADFDNDGDLDLLIPSIYDEENFSFRTALMRNDGSDGADGWVFTDVGAAIDPTTHAQSAWVDNDNDGDLDLFLTNVDPYTKTGFIKIYTNDAGTFSATDPIGVHVEHGLADIGDADADGDLDILVAGNIQEEDETYDTVLRIYTNDAGVYTPNTLIQRRTPTGSTFMRRPGPTTIPTATSICCSRATSSANSRSRENPKSSPTTAARTPRSASTCPRRSARSVAAARSRGSISMATAIWTISFPARSSCPTATVWSKRNCACCATSPTRAMRRPKRPPALTPHPRAKALRWPGPRRATITRRRRSSLTTCNCGATACRSTCRNGCHSPARSTRRRSGRSRTLKRATTPGAFAPSTARTRAAPKPPARSLCRSTWMRSSPTVSMHDTAQSHGDAAKRLRGAAEIDAVE